MNIDRLKLEFLNPSSTYRLAPFWFLNHDLEDPELIWQINEMNNKGVGGFIAHPRHGLITPYLSDQFMDRIETCVKEADRLRMKAYLYDENNWPSGPVDGVLTEKYPEYRMSGCYLSQEWTVQGGKRITEQIEPNDGLIAVVAVPLGRNKRLEGLPESAVSLTRYITDSRLDWTAPAGSRWQVMVFTRKFLVPFGFFGGYLDTLSKPAVAKFIEMTHEKYADRLSEYFGGTVDGIFTDEPAMNYNPREALPWTPTLPSEFSSRRGYDIIKALPALFKDASQTSEQLKCDFYKTVTELYTEAFFRQIYDWCDKRLLNFIGHVACEGEFYQESKHQGDFFSTAQYMHFGGVDFLTDSTWPDLDNPEALNNLVGPKLASSAAHLYDKQRVMSEAFGLAKVWEIDLRTLKCLTDWQVALGVNLIEPHAFYYSIQGFRKWECPPGEFYQSSFWPYYRTFADYTARLCSMLSDGFHVADVAVVFPVRAMWAAMGPDKTPEADKLIRTFSRVTSGLLAAGFDFDIMPEEELINRLDPVELEHIECLEQYKAIIVPGCTTVLETTADILGIAIQYKNPVVFCGDMPRRFVTATASWHLKGDITPAQFADQICLKYDWKTGRLEKRNSSDESDNLAAMIPDVDTKSFEDITQALSLTLSELIQPDVIISEDESKAYVPEIVHCHYRRRDVDFIFLANTSRDKGFRTTVTIDAFGVPAIWNTMTGDVILIEEYEFEDEYIKLKLDFEPTQSYLIGIISKEIWEPAKEAKKPGKEKVITLADEWDFEAVTPNVLPITNWQIVMGGASENSWGYGWRTYTAEFESDIEPKSARLLLDGLVIDKIWRNTVPVPLRVTLNDELVKDFEQGSYLDHLIREADVSGLIKTGKNILKIWTRTEIAPAGSLTEPAYIIGDFALDNGRLIKPTGKMHTGSWTDQGYPYLSGIGAYRQKVELTSPKGRILLRMEKPQDMAEIIINGRQAGVLAWEPWEVDITEFVKNGFNDIEIRIANSMTNLLALDPKPSGLAGKVEIIERL